MSAGPQSQNSSGPAASASAVPSQIPPNMPIPPTAITAEDPSTSTSSAPTTSTAPTTHEATAVDKSNQLITECRALAADSKFQDAARKLREAAHITPGNPAVKAALQELRDAEAKSPVVELVRKWVGTRSLEDGEKVLGVVKGRGEGLEPSVGREAVELLFDFAAPERKPRSISVVSLMGGRDRDREAEDEHDELEDLLDHVTGEVMKSPSARAVLAERLLAEPTQTFSMLFDRGDDTADAVVTTCVDGKPWKSEKEQIAAQRDVFQLALAQSMKAGLDHPERAMRMIAKLLAAEASHLHGLIDADSFDVVLSSLDIRHSPLLRSQATLATAKLLELSPDTAQKVITNFVTSRIKKPTTDSLIMGFSAAAAIFPITPSVAATLFLTEGFMPEFVNLIQEKKSQRLDQAALELLSAACVDKTCREAISKYCRYWIQGIAQAAMDQKRSTLAALVLVKISDEREVPKGPRIPVEEIDEPRPQDELVARFKSIVLSSDHSTKQDSIEGLAYASLQPKIKEQLAQDPIFLHRLIETMSDGTAWKTIMFGGLTIFVNLTAYRAPQSEESKRMADLRAYANASKPSAPDPLDDDAHVTKRCKAVLNSNIIPLLVGSIKRASPAVLSQMLQITLALSKEPKHRGLMAQQGAVKLVLQVWETIHKEQHPVPTSYSPATNHACALTLARILISLNPTSVFGGSSTFPATNAIRPLLSLLTPQDSASSHPLSSTSSDTIDLLPTFESLLALTNLASMPSDPIPRETILRLSFPHLESSLLLHNNPLVRRAAVELLCNLMQSPNCAAKFFPSPSPPSPPSTSKSSSKTPHQSPNPSNTTTFLTNDPHPTPSHPPTSPSQAHHRTHILLALSSSPDLPTRRAASGALAILTSSFPASLPSLLATPKAVELILGAVADAESEEVVHRGLVVLANLMDGVGEVGREARARVRAEGGVGVVRDAVGRAGGMEVRGVGGEVLRGLGEG